MILDYCVKLAINWRNVKDSMNDKLQRDRSAKYDDKFTHQLVMESQSDLRRSRVLTLKETGHDLKQNAAGQGDQIYACAPTNCTTLSQSRLS